MRRGRVIVLAVVGLAAIGLLLLVSGLDVSGTAADNPVDDQAGLLSRAERQRLAEFHRAILESYDIDYRVAIVNGSSDANMAAAQRFADRDVGSASERGNGLLLLVAPDAEVVRIEVGRSLEPVFTDAFIAYVEKRQMVPFFQSNRVAEGILATTELIAQQADAAASAGNQGFARADGESERSGGAGARAEVRIGEGYEPMRRSWGTDVGTAGSDPRELVATYLSAMAAGNANPELRIFTPATRSMLADHLVTPAQMRQVAETYRRCPEAELFQEGDRAVLRYPVDDRQCAPFFLERSESGWQLDLSLMASAIRFNHRNQWRFADGLPAEFAFAFRDWRFDKHGFPD